MAPSIEEMKRRIKERRFKVGVIGMGYVGLPLAMEFSLAGFGVRGFDVDGEKVRKLNAGESYIRHIPAGRIREALSKGFLATADFSGIAECDAILICVPTPLTGNREPDMTYIESTCREVARHLRSGQLIILESTTYPGTTEEVMKPLLEQSGLEAGKDFHLAFSPEREDPNNPDYSTSTIPKVIGGYTPQCLDLAVTLYGQVIRRVVPVISLKVAEASKILENTFRAVNIALVNELKMIFDRMGIDVWEVIDAASTKPFGFMRFLPGPGLGGHCIPIDPFYLSWKAREFDTTTRFIEMAGEINASMPYYVVSRLVEALSERGRCLNGARILLVGLSYKKNVDDTRESPSLKLLEILDKRGAIIDYHDPIIPVLPPSRKYPHFAGKQSVDLESAGDYDAVLIATDHDAIDWKGLLGKAKLIVDTRGVYREPSPNVVKA